MIEWSLDRISHRGPDGRGIREGDEYTLGAVRLAINDLAGGDQPHTSEDGTIHAVVNGEIYNAPSLRERLSGSHSFASRCDTETVVHLYEDHGLDCFSKLHGMFAIAIWDERESRGIVARDGAGIKPLYYTDGEQFRFCSEIKGLGELGSFRADIQEVTRTLAYRSSSLGRTCFHGVHEVEPGTACVYSGEDYSTVEFTPQLEPIGTPAEAYRDSLESRLMADVGIGAFLSGGIDSSLNVVAASDRLSDPPPTYTAGFGESTDEFDVASGVARSVDTSHHEVEIDYRTMTRDFSTVLYHMDEPFLDPAVFPIYYLARRATRDVKVVLVGTGADEVFAGYEKHVALLNGSTSAPERAANFLQARRPFPSETLRALGTAQPRDVVALQRNLSNSEEMLHEARRIDRELMMPTLQLMKVDRATMAHGIEARVPFLDSRLVELMDDQPQDVLLESGPKSVLRSIARSEYPQYDWSREKQIFFVPLERWLEESLHDRYREEVPQSPLLQEIFDVNLLERCLPDLTPYQQWSLLVVARWHSIFCEPETPHRPVP